jgi:hypothetical protein
MNSVENLKFTEFRELIIIINSIPMQNLNTFGVGQGFLFEFASLNGVWKFGGILLSGRAHQSAAQRVLTAHTSHRTCATRHRPSHHAVTALTSESAQVPIVAAAHAGAVLIQRSGGFPPICLSSSHAISALLHTNRHFTHHRQPPMSRL